MELAKSTEMNLRCERRCRGERSCASTDTAFHLQRRSSTTEALTCLALGLRFVRGPEVLLLHSMIRNRQHGPSSGKECGSAVVTQEWQSRR
jgi:hypothetical protein